MDSSEYKRRKALDEETEKMKRQEMYEDNIKAAEKAEKTVLEKRMRSLFGLEPKSNKKHRGERACDKIRNIRQEEKKGNISEEFADDECRMLSLASYCELCMDYPRQD